MNKEFTHLFAQLDDEQLLELYRACRKISPSELTMSEVCLTMCLQITLTERGKLNSRGEETHGD